jgi:AraC-like DNA-binding protein
MAEAVPEADIQRAVLRFQGFEALAPTSFSDRVTAGLFLPVIINFGDRWQIASGGVSPSGFDSFTAGLIDRYTDITAAGRPACLQINLTPFGARALFDRPLHQLACSVADLSDLLGPEAHDLADQFANQRDWRSRLTLADTFVRKRLQTAQLPDRRTVAAWRMMHMTGGTMRIALIAERLDMSREHLSRLFREQIGHSPKAVSRIIRFQRATRLAPDLSYDWAAVAHETGYADQAHLVREFGRMSGITPAKWAASHSFNTPDQHREKVG